MDHSFDGNVPVGGGHTEHEGERIDRSKTTPEGTGTGGRMSDGAFDRDVPTRVQNVWKEPIGRGSHP